MNNNSKYLWTSSEWSFPSIKKVDAAIRKIACGEFNLDINPIQIEIITSDQMLSTYSSMGLPVFYEHWSFGKHFLSRKEAYNYGQMGLSYEVVINSNPCIAYLMEENSMTMQALVIAHACYGHNSFYKGNYCFKEWSNAKGAVDYFIFARNYIRKCEEKYGYKEVEEILDSCHAIMNYGVDRYKKPKKLSLEKEEERQRKREEYIQSQVNEIWSTLPSIKKKIKKKEKVFPKEPTENLLYFIEKNSPILKVWQKEIVRIIRKTATYFYPQLLTKMMNEGWATFFHYEIFRQLEKKGIITNSAFIEFIKSHSNLINMPDYNSKHFQGINPYTLGFNMFRDIKRICQKPTKEDKEWFPDIAGSDYLKTFDFIMRNFRDESFILQFLSPKVIRDLKLFSINDRGEKSNSCTVNFIHDNNGYKKIRQQLSKNYNPSYTIPNIMIDKVDKDGNRSMHLKHYMVDGKYLDKGVTEVLKHIRRLWGFKIHLASVNDEGLVLKVYDAN